MIPASHRARTTCGACHGTGHSVGRCVAPAAIAYWREAAQRHRVMEAAHLEEVRRAVADGVADEAAYQRRAAALHASDAARCERKRARVEAVRR